MLTLLIFDIRNLMDDQCLLPCTYNHCNFDRVNIEYLTGTIKNVKILHYLVFLFSVCMLSMIIIIVITVSMINWYSFWDLMSLVQTILKKDLIHMNGWKSHIMII